MSAAKRVRRRQAAPSRPESGSSVGPLSELTRAIPGEKQARLSFVAEGDIGARWEGLRPQSAILVRPCDRYVGPGHYQLLIGGRLLVRDCFQLNHLAIRVCDQQRSGEWIYADPTPEEFADQVCGLVLAKLSVIDKELQRDLWTCREDRP